MRIAGVLISCLIFCGQGLAGGIAPEAEIPWSKIKFRVLTGKSQNSEYCRGEELINLNAGILSKRTQYFKASAPSDFLQEENVRFDLQSLRVLDYEFRNHMTGESVDLKMPQPPVAEVAYRGPIPQANKTRDEAAIKWTWTTSTILGKTLHHFMVRQWDKIISGGKPKFDLFVPMKRDAYGFQLRQGKVYNPGNGPERRVLHLEPSNWAIRQFVPEMAFHYEVVEGVPRLAVYEGASTIAIDGEDNKPVRIEFDYVK